MDISEAENASKQVIRIGLDDFIYINLTLQMIFEIHRSIEYDGIEVIVNQIYSMSFASIENVNEQGCNLELKDKPLNSFPWKNKTRIKEEIFTTNIGKFLNSLNAQSLIPLRVETIGSATFTFRFLDRFLFSGRNSSREVLEELLSLTD